MTVKYPAAIVFATLLSLGTSVAGAQMLTPVVPPTDSDLTSAAEAPPEPTTRSEHTRIGDMVIERLEPPKAATEFYTFQSMPWPNGVLPVVFATTVAANERQQFFDLCNGVWGGLANVRCVARSTQASWVHVTKEADGCYAYVGSTGAGARQLNLAQNCWQPATILHEIAHILGLGHEHQRPGRDQFIDIRRENIRSDYANQFEVFAIGSTDFWTTTYDFQSLMHYGPTAGSLNDQPTIVPKPQYAALAGDFGNATLPSAGDALLVRHLYGAPVAVTAPGTPVSLEATVSGSTVTLSWRPPTGGGTPTSYYVTIRSALGAVLGAGDIGNFLSAYASYSPGTYVFSVQARNAAGTGTAATVQVTVGSTAVTAPGAPAALNAAVSGSNVTLSWRTPATGGAPTSYYVTIRSAIGAVLGAGDVGNSLSASASYSPGTYVFSVQARNAAGTGTAATVQVTVGNTGVRPGAPANLVGTAQGSTLTLRWAAPVTPGQVQGYVLHYGFQPGFATGHQIDLGATTAVSFPNVPSGTFYLRVVARNQYGSSSASNEVRVVIGGVSAPGAPSLMPVESRGANVFRISWQPGAGGPATSYLLDVSATPGGAVYLTLPVTGTEWVGSAPTGVYYLRLRAVNGAGTSAPSGTQVLVAR